MAETKWFKMHLGWWESEWLIVLSAECRLCWVLFIERVKSNGVRGTLKKSDPAHLARIWYVGEESVRQMLKAAVLDGAVTDEETSWTVANWRAYQADETGAERQARFKSKQKSNGGNALPSFGNGGNASNAENENENENENEKRNKPPSGAKKESFQRPTLAECEAYCLEISIPRLEGQKFFDHFSSNGWRVGGKSAMKDWKAALRTWKSRLSNVPPPSPPQRLPRLDKGGAA